MDLSDKVITFVNTLIAKTEEGTLSWRSDKGWQVATLNDPNLEVWVYNNSVYLWRKDSNKHYYIDFYLTESTILRLWKAAHQNNHTLSQELDHFLDALKPDLVPGFKWVRKGEKGNGIEPGIVF